MSVRRLKEASITRSCSAKTSAPLRSEDSSAAACIQAFELVPDLLDLVDCDDDARARLDAALQSDAELDALTRALSGRFIAPVPGGDLIRNPEIVPTGRNIHAFDPFRMPTAFAMAEGAKQADTLLATHKILPRTVAMVLWGSDNNKSDGGPIAQALALIGATPRFDSFLLTLFSLSPA